MDTEMDLSPSTSLPKSSDQTSSSDLRHRVTALYPNALTRIYSVPSVHYAKGIIPGTSRYKLVPGPGQESDFGDDFVQNHVMVNLEELGNSRQEAMFILSRVSVGNCCNKPSYYAAAAQHLGLSDLETHLRNEEEDSRGETDFLLIHRQHGILIGIIKPVGQIQACPQNPQPPADAYVANVVVKAVEQLDRSEKVVRHLVFDIQPGLTVRKTLFLPYVSSRQLQRVLDNAPLLRQTVCGSLFAANAVEAVQLCCCSDQLSQPASYWHVTPAVLSQLRTWWQHRMAYTEDTLLTDEKYLDIVARWVLGNVF
ncbi:uncharacterized protein [Littorina saxatilis]|uniref:uncharacterized protein n=1 Tax=Littorina saxatilis TaxID=31220 RepID=UPI0038B507E9